MIRSATRNEVKAVVFTQYSNFNTILVESTDAKLKNLALTICKMVENSEFPNKDMEKMAMHKLERLVANSDTVAFAVERAFPDFYDQVTAVFH